MPSRKPIDHPVNPITADPALHPPDDDDDSPDETEAPGYRIASGGFHADVDAVAFTQHGKITSLWFLSAIGTQQSCRTMAARMLKPYPDNAALQPNRAAIALAEPWHFNVHKAQDCPSTWTFTIKRLQDSRAWHLVITPLLALHNNPHDQFLLLSPDYGDPDPGRLSQLHYLYLDRRTREPLHPSWAPWLWNHALQTGETKLLDGYGRRAYLCAPNYDLLALEISDAIAAGDLTVPELHTPT